MNRTRFQKLTIKVLVLLAFFILDYSQVNAQEIIDMENDFRVGYYMIQAKHSGKFLNVNDASMNDNANIVQFGNNGATNEHFAVLPVQKEAGRQFFMIMARHSGKFFNVQDGSKSDGAKIRQYKKSVNPKTGEIAPNELFYLKKVDFKTYEVKCKHSGKNWNIKNASMDDRAYLQQYNVNGSGDEFIFHLVEEIHIPQPPPAKTYEIEAIQHYAHTDPVEKIHAQTSISHLPFYMVDDPWAGNAIAENPYYTLTRNDYWKPMAYDFCPETTSEVECNVNYTMGKSWSKTKSKEFSNTTGISITEEAGAEVEGLGLKTSYTLSTQFTFTHGTSNTSDVSESETVSDKFPRGSSVVIWQLYTTFTLERKSGEVVKSWETHLPAFHTSILTCKEKPCN